MLAPEILPPTTYTAVCPVCACRMQVEDSTFADNLHRVAQAAGFDAGLHHLTLSVRCNACVTPQSA